MDRTTAATDTEGLTLAIALVGFLAGFLIGVPLAIAFGWALTTLLGFSAGASLATVHRFGPRRLPR